MLKENRTYTYNEIVDMLQKAQAEAMTKLENDMDEARKECNAKENAMGRVAFTMQNMIAMHTMSMILLKGAKK